MIQYLVPARRLVEDVEVFVHGLVHEAGRQRGDARQLPERVQRLLRRERVARVAVDAAQERQQLLAQPVVAVVPALARGGRMRGEDEGCGKVIEILSTWWTKLQNIGRTRPHALICNQRTFRTRTSRWSI